MAPGGQCIVFFLITLVTHRYFMHRFIFYIDGRLATDCSLAIFDFVGKGGYEEHMGPQSPIMAQFLISSVSYSYFMYRSRFCIDERPETYCSLAIFDLMGQGGYEEHMAPGGQSVLCFLVPSVNYRYFMYRL